MAHVQPAGTLRPFYQRRRLYKDTQTGSKPAGGLPLHRVR